MKTPGLMLVILTTALCAVAADVPKVPAPLVQPPEGPGLVITAESQTVSLKTNTVVYSNNVVATYPPSKPGDFPAILHADVITGQWGGHSKVTNVTAIGRVQLDNGENHARGGRAVYSSDTEQIVLTEAYSVEFPLPMLYSTQVTNTGTNIIYDRRESKLFIKGVTTEVPASTVSKADLSLTGSAKTNAHKTNIVTAPNTNNPAKTNKVRPVRSKGLFQ